MMGILIVTVVCIVAVGYTYIIYPVLIRILSAAKKPNSICYESTENLPGVTVVMAAYNEEKVIAEKIQSILKSNYPADKIEILIGSDNSTDSTDTIINRFASADHRIRLVRFNQRTGKTGIINELVKQSVNSLLILTDANVMFDNDTLFQLIRNFKNESITLVDSRMINTGIKKEGISLQEKTYIRAEVYIKYCEGKTWGTMMGPFGGCYAIRKSGFRPVPAHFLVDDFYINMQVLLNGGKCISELNAFAFEDAGNNPAIEFKRKVRIASGSFQNLFHFAKILLKPGAVSFCFFSHKVLRWLGPLFIVFFYAGSIILSYIPFFFFIMIGSSLVFISPLIELLLRKVFRLHSPLIKFLSYFTTSNAAQLAGLWRFISGIRSGIWQPTSRNQ
ncbi:MAG: glycosyltransferase [Bacteroidota bacterium]